ncbi:MAG: NAD-dependent epimerase/dehydratase family protein [Planctomycetes bacterium]|nr:NAD-dependent epimerase/dehydratase family protein [Planctomycetota bacterium]
MQFKKVMVTGGAGFVGAHLALLLKQAFPDISVWACDNLKRRGSELNLPRLVRGGVGFLHGDIRCPEDVASWPAFDLLVDCSAEPSVQAGLDGSPLPVIQNNLAGTVNCLEAARRHQAALLFISTSRVYPIGPVNALPFTEQSERFVWTAGTTCVGWSPRGLAEDFPLAGARSLYGATKLAAELLLQEYAFSYGLPVLINRCGLLTGPWQMGKVDQGVVALWVARHHFGSQLKYTGFGGQGKQVRDLLHVHDFFDLLLRQLEQLSAWDGRAYNVGGGPEISVSLRELTRLCQDATGQQIQIASDSSTSPVDVRIYLTDSSRVQRDFHWQPRRTPADIVADIASWIREHEAVVRPILCSPKPTNYRRPVVRDRENNDNPG